MIGYVGDRARRKKRNTTTIIVLIVVGVLMYLVFSKIQLDENKPLDTLLPSEEETILPSEEETISPELKIDLAELELQIFQKEQKIIFRDQQINKMKKKIEILTV